MAARRVYPGRAPRFAVSRERSFGSVSAGTVEPAGEEMMPWSVPERMRCVEISQPGGPEVLKPATRLTPVPGPQEVLIKSPLPGSMAPTSTSGADSTLRLGVTDILGLEVSGTIVALGDRADEWRVGDVCCALTAGGGYAEYCTAPAVQCLPIPAASIWSMPPGCRRAFSRSGVTSSSAPRSDESLLVHGGGGGIGTTAIQIAAAFGNRVFTTAAGPEQCAALEQLGATRTIDFTREDFAAVLKEATGGKGVNVILDIVGGDYVARDIASLARDGRLVQIAFLKAARSRST